MGDFEVAPLLSQFEGVLAIISRRIDGAPPAGPHAPGQTKRRLDGGPNHPKVARTVA